MKKNIDDILNEIVDKISLGYTHENFNEIGRLIKEIKSKLDKEEAVFLENSWRDTYTDSCDQQTLEQKVEKIKQRLKK